MKEKIMISIPLSIFYSLSLSAFFPSLRFYSFAPLLIIMMVENISFVKILWISVLCGLFIDLFSNNTFGLNAINYAIAVAICYRYKNLFNEKPINISFFVYLFSIVFLIASYILLFTFEKSFSTKFSHLISDMVMVPVINAMYAFFGFSIIFLFYKSIKTKLILFKRRRVK
jgi:rod shape-determining protein MreD